MSFGFSIGDFVAAGELAYKLYSACCAAHEDYHELAEVCREVSIAVNACSPNDPRSVLKDQHAEAISLIGLNCLRTLERLQSLLSKYDSLSVAQNFGKRLGFISAKSERESIRSRLQEHLGAINTILNGVQLDVLAFATRLLFTMAKAQGGGSNTVDLQKVVNNPTKLQDLFKELGEESKVLKDQLEENKNVIQEKLKEAVQNQSDSDSLSYSKATDKSTSGEIPERVGNLRGPTAASTKSYDPQSIEWYAAGGNRFLVPVSVVDAKSLKERPLDPVIRYSEADEFLCKLPEGWSMTQTLLSRGPISKPEEAFYYSFNNLSCSGDNIPRTSRAYFYTNPFLSYSPQLIATLANPACRFLQLYTPVQQPTPSNPFGFAAPPEYIAYAGFLLYGLPHVPIDLGDDLSREYAMLQTGNNGGPIQYSNAVIGKGLPKHWTFDPDDTGNGHHIYIDGEIGIESETTVHPSRFYDETSDCPTQLPPGWDRRLDSWGNLFFVDKNTKIAVREDPRFDPKIDQNTGLPIGWHSIKDHTNDRSFFYTNIGKIIVGTYLAPSMNDRSLRGKTILSDIPKNGQDPHLLARRDRPRDRRRDVEKQKREQEKARSRGRKMTGEEKQQYSRLFEEAPKANPHFISLGEATEHCKSFQISPTTALVILVKSDSDHDQQLDCDEYATALHSIRLHLENEFQNNPILPATAQQKTSYHGLFAKAEKARSHVMTVDEVWEYSQSLGLPDDLVKSTWERNDTNQDQLYNPNEFANGFHELTCEFQRRSALRMEAHPPPQIVHRVPPQSEAEVEAVATGGASTSSGVEAQGEPGIDSGIDQTPSTAASLGEPEEEVPSTKDAAAVADEVQNSSSGDDTEQKSTVE